MTTNQDRYYRDAPDEGRELVPAPGAALSRSYGLNGNFTGSAPTAAESFFISVHEYWRVLRRYKWLIISIALAFVAIGGVRTLMTTRLYTATVRLQIDRNVAKIIESGNVAPAESGDFEFLRTQYELLQSRGIAERVVSSLKLADDQDFLKPREFSILGKITGMFSSSDGQTARTRAATERSQAGLILANRVVRPVAGSRLIDISYTDPVPARAQAITMGLADAFIASNLDKRFQANSYAKSFLEDQLKQLQVRLQDSEKVVLEFGQREQIIATSEKSSIAENNLSSANAALGALISERIKNEQLYKQVESVEAATLPQFLTNQVIAGLREKRNALITEYQEKVETFKPSYPAMIQINNKIKEIERQLAVEVRTIKRSLKGAFDASVSQEGEMKRQIDSLRAEVLDLQKRSIQYNLLKREADGNRALYDSLLQRYKEVDVAGGIGANNVFIVDKAEVPGTPSSPQVMSNTLLAIVLGLLAGLAAAFVLERLDNTVATMDEVERLTGLATLGVIPNVGMDRELVTELEDIRSGVSEAYRTLCTSLHFATDHGLPKSMLITSSTASEGKSTSALMVSRHFAHMGLRVLLIDGDLRKPSLHLKLGVDNSKGFTNYLTGACSPLEAMQSTTTKNLTFMSSGPLPPNASDLLASPRLISFLTTGIEVFDFIIIDGPPVMGLADAQLLSNAVAATILVVSSGSTSKHSIRAALKRLQFARSNVIGTVLTHYDSKNESYGYGYDYGYGYGYGHSAPKEAKLEDKTAAGEKVAS